jgi:hypothetical protein
LGRDVVPEVNNTTATSSGSAKAATGSVDRAASMNSSDVITRLPESGTTSRYSASTTISGSGSRSMSCRSPSALSR